MRVTLITDDVGRAKNLENFLATAKETMSIQPITTLFDELIERAVVEFRPDLIVLSVNIAEPWYSFMALRLLKASESLRQIPVVVLSLLDSKHRFAKKARRLGAVAVFSTMPYPKIEEVLRCASMRADSIKPG